MAIRFHFKCLFLVVIMAAAGGARAVATFDETTLGDYSNDGAHPTPLSFLPGLNHVFGTMGADFSTPLDPDIFTFTVPFGYSLTSIYLHYRIPAERSFFAIATGNSIHTNVTHPVENGSSHLSNMLTRQNGEMINELASTKEFGGPSLMTSPLGPGSYAIWYQELSNRVNYDFSFQLDAAPVPEPKSTSLVMAVALVMIVVVLRPRRS
jgi:hypothetical protein